MLRCTVFEYFFCSRQLIKIQKALHLIKCLALLNLSGVYCSMVWRYVASRSTDVILNRVKKFWSTWILHRFFIFYTDFTELTQFCFMILTQFLSNQKTLNTRPCCICNFKMISKPYSIQGTSPNFVTFRHP